MRVLGSVLLSGLVCLGGCQLGEPPPEPSVVPPAEDLSTWHVPTLVQPEPSPAPPLPLPSRPASAAEKVYAYVPGSVTKVKVALDAPLDLILEPGEQVLALIGSDPTPIQADPAAPTTAQEDAPPKVTARWDYKEARSGAGDDATAHIFLRALVPGATLGLTMTTTRRVYYLTCQSVSISPIRAVRWTYTDAPLPVPSPAMDRPRLLPHPETPRLYHVGYVLMSSSALPTWAPRQVLDDGTKFYLIYPEIVLFGTVPLVRLIGPNGPQVVNSQQVLNVVMLDLADVPRVELRVGTGPEAELVTITRSRALRTIQCPGDPDCPRWPAAAQHLEGRQP